MYLEDENRVGFFCCFFFYHKLKIDEQCCELRLENDKRAVDVVVAEK